jgi:alpha-1,6-mannosyltransferase
MRIPQLTTGRWLFLLGPMLLMLTGDILLGYFVTQSQFFFILGGYSMMFLGYASLVILAHDEELPILLGLAILLRLVLLFEVPLLSDDIYRFVWDGRLLLQGISPFEQVPSFYLTPGNEVTGLSESLFQKLNSPDYYSVYPPVAQGTFALAAWIAPDSIWGFSLVLKSLAVAFEVGTLLLLIRILKALDLSPFNALLYGLNPLVIIELTGNLHFESGMIFFLALGIWLLILQRWKWAIPALAGSVASKLLPLLFFPFFIRRFGIRRALLFFAGVGLLLVLLFVPLLHASWLANMGKSLDLYFQKFEFNGSVYYLLRWLGMQLLGFNPIQWLGPILGIFVFLGIVWKAVREDRLDWKSWPYASLFAITLYLALGTTVHPWYLAMPVFLCTLTYFRFPLFWSFLITLTYINYSYSPYWENTWIVGLEYVAVGLFLLWELRNKTWKIEHY